MGACCTNKNERRKKDVPTSKNSGLLRGLWLPLTPVLGPCSVDAALSSYPVLGNRYRVLAQQL